MSGLFEILAFEETPLGLLCLRRREVLGHAGAIVTEITLNHEFLMSSYNTVSERALANLAVDMHGGDELTVLVGGLGLGYTAAEVLKSSRVKSVEVVEFLPQVIGWLEQGLFPLAGDLNGEERFSVTSGDVYEVLAQPPELKYDLILIDVDHSPDDRLDEGPGFFYTSDGLRLAKKHLAADGVLAVWSYEGSSPFSEALHGVFEEVRTEAIEFENELVEQECTDWLFLARG